MAHIRESRPDSGLGFQVKVLEIVFAHARRPSLGTAAVRTGLCRNVKRFRRGLVFKAHRRLYHSTLGLRVIKKKKRRNRPSACRCVAHANSARVEAHELGRVSSYTNILGGIRLWVGVPWESSALAAPLPVSQSTLSLSRSIIPVESGPKSLRRPLSGVARML